jgi:hypothetical protein
MYLTFFYFLPLTTEKSALHFENKLTDFPESHTYISPEDLTAAIYFCFTFQNV